MDAVMAYNMMQRHGMVGVGRPHVGATVVTGAPSAWSNQLARAPSAVPQRAPREAAATGRPARRVPSGWAWVHPHAPSLGHTPQLTPAEPVRRVSLAHGASQPALTRTNGQVAAAMSSSYHPTTRRHPHPSPEASGITLLAQVGLLEAAAGAAGKRQPSSSTLSVSAAPADRAGPGPRPFGNVRASSPRTQERSPRHRRGGSELPEPKHHVGVGKNASRRYRGVTLCQSKRWRCKIYCDKRTLNIGRFDKAIQAALAYDIAAWFTRGATMNFTVPEVYRYCREVDVDMAGLVWERLLDAGVVKRSKRTETMRKFMEAGREAEHAERAARQARDTSAASRSSTRTHSSRGDGGVGGGSVEERRREVEVVVVGPESEAGSQPPRVGAKNHRHRHRGTSREAASMNSHNNNKRERLLDEEASVRVAKRSRRVYAHTEVA